MPKVFISHATADRGLVTRDVIDLLKDHDVESWFAEDDIATGRHWEGSILEGLKSCDWFLVALTPRAVESEWVKDEVHWAIEERPGRIVPILIEDCNVRDIHIRLPRIQHVDFREANNDARRRLLACWDIEFRESVQFHVRFNSVGDRYSIDEPISSRDFLREFLGKDTALNRPVLVKCDRDGGTYGDQDRSPVATEVFATASLVHPSIPSVFDLANDDELGTYSVLEHIPGMALRDRIKERDLFPIPDVIELMIPICHAVHYANENGVIHRNIKPSSIVLGDNCQPYLTNFIVAKLPDQNDESGAMVGTPMYMAPEQCNGDANLDCRVDVWGLGVLLYEVLTGKLPFHREGLGNNPSDTIKSIMNELPIRLRDYNKTIPKDLERICMKCLEKNREDRYSTASELAADLTATLQRQGRLWPKQNSMKGHNRVGGGF